MKLFVSMWKYSSILLYLYIEQQQANHITNLYHHYSKSKYWSEFTGVYLWPLVKGNHLPIPNNIVLLFHECYINEMTLPPSEINFLQSTWFPCSSSNLADCILIVHALLLLNSVSGLRHITNSLIINSPKDISVVSSFGITQINLLWISMCRFICENIHIAWVKLFFTS